MAPLRKEAAPRKRKRTRVAEDIKYRFVFKQNKGSRYVVSPRVGYDRVLGTYDDAKIAAEAAAAAWNVPLSSLVQPRRARAKRVWTVTAYRWIWQRGIDNYVLRRRCEGVDFVRCGKLQDLVDVAVTEWGLTKADMMKVPGESDDAEVPKDDDEEMPATQPYPEEVPEAHDEGLARHARQSLDAEECVAAALAPDQTKEQRDSDDDNRPPANVKWGPAKFVAATLAADPHLLPGDIADLEGRAAGLAYNLRACFVMRWGDGLYGLVHDGCHLGAAL